MEKIGEIARTLTENKWCMLALSIFMMYSSISILWRIAATTTTNKATYKTNNGKIEVNDSTYIETNDKLYRLRAFKLNGDAIIQEIWEDTETNDIRKGEHEYISKKEMIKLLETSIKIVKGP